MKKTFFLLSLSLCLKLVSFGQLDIATQYGNAITAGDLKKHLSIIASDEMEGRETGTEGQRKAAAYIESQFKAIGLTSAVDLKGYQQLYPLFQDSLKITDLAIDGKAAVFGKDFIIPLNTNENGKFKGKEIIFVGYGIDDPKYNDYDGLDVKGKVVVFFLGEPKKDGKYIVTETAKSSEWTFPGICKQWQKNRSLLSKK
jgi:hypothetical protein